MRNITEKFLSTIFLFCGIIFVLAVFEYVIQINVANIPSTVQSGEFESQITDIADRG